jgi:heme/copper-type cytochrome/quinol oxidase subunit 1
MTLTDTQESDTEEALAEPESTSASTAPAGLAGALSTGDHKSLGLTWIVFALLFGTFTMVIGTLAGFERVDSDGVNIFGGFESYLQMVTLYRVSMVFLFVVPLLIGLATYVVPLQIGASSVAFPRLAAASMWTWVVASGILIAAWSIDGGLVPGGEPEAVQLSILSFAVVVAAILGATVSLLATIMTQRSEGLDLYRVPFFSWSMLVAGGVWLLSLPMLLGNLMLMWIDSRGEAITSFGAGENLWPQVSWVFDQPQVFAFAIPVLGIAGDVFSSAFGATQRRYGLTQFSIAAFGVLSFGAYAQSYFFPEAQTTVVFVSASLLLGIPLLMLLGGWADLAVRGNRVSAGAHLPAAVTAVVLLLAGVATAVIKVLGPSLGVLREFDRDGDSWQADIDDLVEPFVDLLNTSIVPALFNLVLISGLAGAVAAIYYWAPKLFGKPMNAVVGWLVSLAILAGALLYAIPDIISAFLDQPDPAPFQSTSSSVDGMNLISAVGVTIVAVGVLVALLAVGQALGGRGGAARENAEDPEANANPWDSGTLEWATESPPLPGNFAAPPVVASAYPLNDPVDSAEEGSDV